MKPVQTLITQWVNSLGYWSFHASREVLNVVLIARTDFCANLFSDLLS